jgi:ADP-dependent NAD(P)H-hydrate dehydratase
MPTPEPVPVTSALLGDWRLPQPSGAKRSRGSVLVIGGSPSTPGAAMLAGLAALRVGAGVLSLAVADSRAASVAAALPEASVVGLSFLDDGGTDTSELEGALPGVDTLLAGPGLDEPDGATVVLEAVADAEGSLVLDAFVLGVLAKTPSARDRVAGRAVLTPNSAEAAHLLARDSDDLGDDVAFEVADRYGCVVTFSGTVAAPDGRRWTVPVGHPGLGTSGSGDVLAGCLAGLLARGADLAQAACWATFLHASAGDRLAARVGRLGFLARELADQLPLMLVQTEA